MKYDIAPIFIAPPNITDDSLRELASYGRGYTYLLSRAGVTGTETQAAMPASTLINQLKEYNAAPTLLGFGISKPEHVKIASKEGDGIVVGRGRLDFNHFEPTSWRAFGGLRRQALRGLSQIGSQALRRSEQVRASG